MADYIDKLAQLGTDAGPAAWATVHRVKLDMTEDIAVVGHSGYGLVATVPAFNKADARFIATVRNLWPEIVAFIRETHRVVFEQGHGDHALWDAIEALEQKVEVL